MSTQQRFYGRCDSFFVVNDEEDVYTKAERNRERARAVAKEHQKALGQDLSRLTADEYQEDILDHMEFMESETMPDVSSIDIQTEIQWYMRPYLLDFLIEAHAAFRLLPDTLFLAVNLLDRYCSRRVVYKRHYQLVGCAALFIAAKYNDKKENVPTIKELKSMCCALYDDDMFLQMEWHVLQTLNWQIGHPTVDAFLQIALEEEAPRKDMEAEHMTWYLCELALFHKDFVSLRPSVLARSALALSRCILGRPQIPQSDWACRYDSTIILNLANFLSQPSAVLRRKYSYGNMSCVAQSVDYFLQAQQNQQKAAAEAQQKALEQAQQATLRSHSSIPHLVIEESSMQQSTFLQPQTPQKISNSTDPFITVPGAAVMQHGCLTPPITPENEHMFNSNNVNKGGYLQGWPQPPTGVAQHMPPTPTPVPSSHGYMQQQQQQMVHMVGY